jgi:hypothetical protein
VLGENTSIIKNNTKALPEVSRVVDVEANAEKTMYMVVSHH